MSTSGDLVLIDYRLFFKTLLMILQKPASIFYQIDL